MSASELTERELLDRVGQMEPSEVDAFFDRRCRAVVEALNLNRAALVNFRRILIEVNEYRRFYDLIGDSS